MISMDKKYKTRDGQEVRLLCVDAPGGFPVVGLLGETVSTWCADGSFFLSEKPENLDLIETPETIEIDVWINVYINSLVGDAYLTKSDADDNASAGLDRKACINIKRTVTVGEGLTAVD